MQTQAVSDRPVFNPASISLTYSEVDDHGFVTYNILANGLCVEEHKCRAWELGDRLDIFIEHMFKVC